MYFYDAQFTRKKSMTSHSAQDHFIWHIISSICISFQTITFKIIAAHITLCMHLGVFIKFIPSFRHSRARACMTDYAQRNFLNVVIWKNRQILQSICRIQCFLLAPAVKFYFIFRIFLVNSRSYRCRPLDIFHVLPTRISLCKDCVQFPVINTEIR